MKPLPELLQERQRLAAKLESLEHTARLLREELSVIDSELSERFAQLANALGVPAASSICPSRRLGGEFADLLGGPRKVSGSDIDTWIETVLREHGPMRPKQIWEAILAKGVEVSGRDPVNNVSARLSNSDRFYKLESGQGWWIKDEPVPPSQEIQDLV